MKRFLKPHIFVMLATFIILCVILFCPLGVADGGSHHKTLERLGLYYLSDTSYANMTYGVMSNDSVTILTSHDALIHLTRVISERQQPDGVTIYDIRVLGAVYGLLLIIALGLIVWASEYKRRPLSNWLLAVLLVFVFADFSYTTYFNSFYIEPFIMVLLLLLFGLWWCIIRLQNVKIWILLSLTAIGIILVFTFNVVAISIVFIFSFMIVTAWGLARSKWRKSLLLLCALILLTTTVAAPLYYTSPNYKQNLYHSVFQGVGYHTSISSISGVSPALNVLTGTFYSEEAASKYSLDDRFYSNIRYGNVIQFYQKFPKLLWKQLTFASNNGYNVRLPGHGNFTKESQKEPTELAKGFSLYSNIKYKFFPHRINFFLACCLLITYMMLSICYYYIMRGGRPGPIGLLLAMMMMALVSLAFPIFLTGRFEIGRNMFIFNVMYDCLLITSIIGETRFVFDRQEELKNQYGVTQ